MRNLKYFRIINNTEKNIIINSLSKISPDISSILNKIEFKLFISFNDSSSKNNYPFIFLVPNNLIKNINKLTHKDINSAGLYFGFIKKNQFFLSIEGAEFLHNQNLISEKHQICVNENGEKAILYGNKILKKMLIPIEPNMKKNDFLLVFNRLNELVAIAQSQVDFEDIQNLKPNECIAINLVDKGYYLRKKQ